MVWCLRARERERPAETRGSQSRARPGCGCRGSELGFRVLGFGIRDSGFGFRDSGLGFWVLGFGIRVSGFEIRVSGFRIRGSGFGFRDSGFGIRVSGFRIRDSGFGWHLRSCDSDAPIEKNSGKCPRIFRTRHHQRAQTSSPNLTRNCQATGGHMRILRSAAV